jgi:hypothetical protein
MKTKTRKDSKNRVWTYHDSEGAWTFEKHIIGCGKRNGSKFQIWDGPSKGFYEYKNLSEAMNNCE